MKCCEFGPKSPLATNVISKASFWGQVFCYLNASQSGKGRQKTIMTIFLEQYIPQLAETHPCPLATPKQGIRAHKYASNLFQSWEVPDSCSEICWFDLFHRLQTWATHRLPVLPSSKGTHLEALSSCSGPASVNVKVNTTKLWVKSWWT